MIVAFADAEPNGLADLVGRLIEANLDRAPGRRVLLREMVIRLTATDARIQATIHVSPRGVEVSNGAADPHTHLRVRATATDLLELASAPLRLGFPDPLRHEGRRIVRLLAVGDVRISGMFRHPIRLSRFTRLLSAAA